MKLSLVVFIILCVNTIKAQENQSKEDKIHLYWHSNVKIEFSHFQSKLDSNCFKANDKYGFKMSPNIRLIGVVDVPKSHLKRKIRKRKGYDKLYLSPVFCKECSCILSRDSMELMTYELLFDVAEMCARGIRRDLRETQEKMNINNVNTMFYKTIESKWDRRMRGTWSSIYEDVLINKKKNSYLEWRKLVDEILSDNVSLATQPNDIQRLINGKPIEKDFIEAESIIGDLNSKTGN